jgi:hypothetical protein
VRVGESIALKCLRKFVVTVVEVFGFEYLRLPNEQDTVKLLAIGESRGFSGMFGFIDCMHWGWKIVLLFGMKCTEIIKRSLQLYWKQLFLKTYCFDMYSLECLTRTMISMFCNGLR